MNGITIKTQRLLLRSLIPEDVSENYLQWLNDEQLQYYTRRHGKVTTQAELEKFVADSQNSPDGHLAIFVADDQRHIGNIFLNNFDGTKQEADLSIMIGDTAAQGQGYATEAINAVIDFAFNELGLKRLYAASPNPAFNKMISKLGWKQTAVKIGAFVIDEQNYDLVCWEITK